MPRGSKSKYTAKQKRQAAHIEESFENRGVDEETAIKRAWQTVNKLSGGGEKSGSGKETPESVKVAARKEFGKEGSSNEKSEGRPYNGTNGPSPPGLASRHNSSPRP